MKTKTIKKNTIKVKKKLLIQTKILKQLSVDLENQLYQLS